MLIRNNGISIMTALVGAAFTFIVTEQSPEATALIVEAGTILDPGGSGYGLRSSNYPSKNFNDKNYENKKNFYVRGSDTSKDHQVVTVQFDTEQQAAEAEAALKRLVDAVVATPAVVTEIAEATVVSSVKPPRENTTDGSKKAYAAVTKLLDDAEIGGYLVELWRLITGLRSNDAAFPSTGSVVEEVVGESGKTGKEIATGKSGKQEVSSGKAVNTGKDVSTGKTGKTTEEVVEVTGKGKNDARYINTLIRHAVLTASQADILRVTGRSNYPTSRVWNPVDDVQSTGNTHADEHFGVEQGAAGVLNKAFA